MDVGRSWINGWLLSIGGSFYPSSVSFISFLSWGLFNFRVGLADTWIRLIPGNINLVRSNATRQPARIYLLLTASSQALRSYTA